MKRTILTGVLLAASVCSAQEPSELAQWHKQWHRSLVATTVLQGADAVLSMWATSTGRAREMNGVLSKDGQFGTRALGIKTGIVVGNIVAQKWLVRKDPTTARVLTRVNKITAYMYVGVLGWNVGVVIGQ